MFAMADLQMAGVVSVLVGTDNRREFDRVAGPFEARRGGFIETPVKIYDLSVGGCFVNAMHEQEPGVQVALIVNLPGEGWVSLKAETLYRRPGGFAARFVDLTDNTRRRLERAIERLARP
jgi:hypothetical protein